MAKVTYSDGISILQLIVFPFLLACSIYVWKRTGWRAGGSTWRFAVILSLLRVVGSICTLAQLSFTSTNLRTAATVCNLIGIAPQSLMYMGLLRQIDVEYRIPPKPLQSLSLVSLIALIIAIVGVDKTEKSGNINALLKAAMIIFLIVFAAILAATAWLFKETKGTLQKFQKKLFIGIALSAPFYTVRLVYAAIADLGHYEIFQSSLSGNPSASSLTLSLCMSVLEEMVALAIAVAFGWSAMLERDFVTPGAAVPGDFEQQPKAEDV
ncbi:hypothetical protein BO82DRAFT_411795 [Aspergillus uvarum CBS 121591]|uniref:DUF7702 domain-containing protein n=1 Tax=Aspergillus uvarum CBS 121591 TaxID=1448315 RepID=A0A319CBS0_9EURO|nr:hypothetical protein BO82DRAFT_411795 [Aspergillus uvarum CBS 121591]PYH83296.1 hypothetical protein BO82DRAFT_411795 [Aspergillus uvarum CBS 121591]